MQVVVWDRRQGRVTAASDPRGIGAAAVLRQDGPTAGQRWQPGQ
jgi:hypothetical protein